MTPAADTDKLKKLADEITHKLDPAATADVRELIREQCEECRLDFDACFVAGPIDEKQRDSPFVLLPAERGLFLKHAIWIDVKSQRAQLQAIEKTFEAAAKAIGQEPQEIAWRLPPGFVPLVARFVDNLLGSALSVILWGYFLYVGVIDPFGGIWTLWPLFGTANQMLAAIALTVCTVVLFKMKRERYALVTIVPATWLVICTTTAGLEKVFSSDPNVGFISHALKYGNAIAAGQVLAPAKTLAEMTRVVVNDYIDATLAAAFVLVVVATVIYALINIWKALGNPRPTAIEIGLAGAAGVGHV